MEIDIWWGPINHEIEVCHSPGYLLSMRSFRILLLSSPSLSFTVPLYPVGNISRNAAAAGLNLEWQPENMSCIGTKRSFSDTLQEIREWMVLPENSEEIVVIYLDTKFRLKPEQVTLGNEAIRKAFGSLLWTPSDGSPLEFTPRQMRAKGKRVVIENAKDCWLSPSHGQPLVFYPTVSTPVVPCDAVTVTSCVL